MSWALGFTPSPCIAYPRRRNHWQNIRLPVVLSLSPSSVAIKKVRGNTAIFFLEVFFHVTDDGLNKRGTTRSLAKHRQRKSGREGEELSNFFFAVVSPVVSKIGSYETLLPLVSSWRQLFLNCLHWTINIDELQMRKSETLTQNMFFKQRLSGILLKYRW